MVINPTKNMTDSHNAPITITGATLSASCWHVLEKTVCSVSLQCGKFNILYFPLVYCMTINWNVVIHCKIRAEKNGPWKTRDQTPPASSSPMTLTWKKWRRTGLFLFKFAILMLFSLPWASKLNHLKHTFMGKYHKTFIVSHVYPSSPSLDNMIMKAIKV